MASWRDEYMQALSERNLQEEAEYQRIDAGLVEAFTALLDRTAALEARNATSTSPNATSRDAVSSAAGNDNTAQIRSDLAEALRSNGHLQSRIKTAEAELLNLRAKVKMDTKIIEDFTKERVALTRKAKDKGEEVKGKTKLLDDVHDEVISLNLQLNMSEQMNQKLKSENKELIDRWMAQKGMEAEAMNKTFQDRSKG